MKTKKNSRKKKINNSSNKTFKQYKIELKQNKLKQRNNKIKSIQQYINKYKNDLPYSFDEKDKFKLNTNSWFNIDEFKAILPNDYLYLNTITNHQSNNIIYCKKISMNLNNEQKQILNQWFISYTKMYNEGVNYLFNNCQLKKCDINRHYLLNKLKDIPTFFTLRNKLKNITNNLIEQSQISDNSKNTKIHLHTMNYALKQLCSNLKSSITNMLRDNFKRFRLKYWKFNRPSQSIEIEKCYLNKDNKLCYKILGDIDYSYNGKKVDLKDFNIEHGVKINYNLINNEYSLLVPFSYQSESNLDKPNNLISLDPGLRTFMTGVSEDKFIKIGNQVNNNLIQYVKRLNNLKLNKTLTKKQLNDKRIKLENKLTNKVDDLHWKTINYLINNYQTILLGDMSAKKIVNKNTSCLSNNQKVACLRTRYYQFRQRLEYKCKSRNVNYNLINESFTSKLCSSCGYQDNNLGSSKIYDCSQCKNKIDRDVNGSRNIFIKYLLEH